MKGIIILLVLFISSTAVFGQDWRDSLDAGRRAYKEKKYDQALRQITNAQKKAPEGVDLRKEIGNSAYKKGDYELAEKIYEQTANDAESASDRSKELHNLGNSKLKKKDYNGAIDSYKQALRNDPSNEKTRYNLAEAKRRLEEQRQQQNKEDQQNGGKPKDGQGQQGQPKPGEGQGEGQNNPNQNGQPNQGNPGESGDPQKSDKLSSKKTERALDELMKREMETKRKVQGTQSGNKQESPKSGKRW